MPLRSLVHSALIFLFVSAWAALAFAPGYAGSTTGSAPLDVRQAVNSGVELERSRRWIDAIQHYEKAVKSWPDSRELEYGLRRSKIHFSIERRYADGSFHKSLMRLPAAEALQLFDQVFRRIQGHYVEPISATAFVSHGTESLYLALADERFLEANVPHRLRSRAESLRQTLRDEYWNRPVQNPEGVQQVVGRVCRLAADSVGVQATPVILEYVFGGCNALDDYSSLLTPGRLTDLYSNINGEFVGLGVEIRSEPGRGLLLVNVLPGSPAHEGGLLAGEHIVSIDGVDVRDMSTDEAAGRLQGVEGSRVVIEVQRTAAGQARRVSLARRSVTVHSIPVARIIDPDYGVGYIQMNSFQKSTVQELDDALSTLRNQGMRALVWDLRGNPGGLLTAAVEVLDRFIAEGQLVSTKGRTTDQNWTYSAHRPGTWTVPLVLLIDGDSASASEIVAGAVHDHRRGTIVGRTSYGKWSVQSIFEVSVPGGRSLGEQLGLRLTTAKFYSPHGHTLGKIGVRPDIEVAAPETPRHHFRAPTDIDLEGDADVRKALEVLHRQMAAR